MQKKVLGALAGLFALLQAATFTQSGGPPKAAIDITDEEVKAVLKHTPPSTDRQLRIVDMGTYNLAVGVIHRGPTGAGPGAGGGRGGAAGGGAARGATAAPQPCGRSVPGGAPGGLGGLYHDHTVETYIITSGSGTLVTGGEILNGRRSDPESQVTTILNGPSCSGTIGGNPVRRVVKPGDIIIIPEGVPHGWTDIKDHVTYLSVRPDPNKVLQTGYVHPAINK